MALPTGNKQLIEVDSSKGGNGDIWMRLVSFYAFAALLPQYQFAILIPGFFKNLAEYTFGDRLKILTQSDRPLAYTYTSLGIKDLVRDIIKGRRFISPYQRAVIHDKKQKQLKDYVNTAIFNIADGLGVVQVPASVYIEVYQGYLDVIGIKKVRSVDYPRYTAQLKADFEILSSRLAEHVPISPELQIPADLHENVVIFPTGTSRQFIPVWWAKQHLPDAYYAFFHKDKDREEFIAAGLKVLPFYKEPGDIIKLAQSAKWTITTDSFPSHLLQYAVKNCTVLITEVLKSRIVSPVFQGVVVDAVAPCHPCLHLARAVSPLCAAGYPECINWKSEVYTQNIITAVA